MGRRTKGLIGLVAVLLVAWLWHGPAGRGEAFARSLQRQADVMINAAELRQVHVHPRGQAVLEQRLCLPHHQLPLRDDLLVDGKQPEGLQRLEVAPGHVQRHLVAVCFQRFPALPQLLLAGADGAVGAAEVQQGLDQVQGRGGMVAEEGPAGAAQPGRGHTLRTVDQ